MQAAHERDGRGRREERRQEQRRPAAPGTDSRRPIGGRGRGRSPTTDQTTTAATTPSARAGGRSSSTAAAVVVVQKDFERGQRPTAASTTAATATAIATAATATNRVGPTVQPSSSRRLARQQSARGVVAPGTVARPTSEPARVKYDRAVQQRQSRRRRRPGGTAVHYGFGVNITNRLYRCDGRERVSDLYLRYIRALSVANII